ncbi:hypothetical protein UQ64_11470 [Paenibacillus etheri]|uniref:Uncharacterized protein n=1 Tax=Paenibacillus etheri TaxID=1306852 RepID=A0A0W1B1I7_9BACL|nr:hypothetical protein UQ64_11470 [Paenibacillus etheri]
MDSTNAWNPTNRAITKIATIEITQDTTNVKACLNVGFKERRTNKRNKPLQTIPLLFCLLLIQIIR